MTLTLTLEEAARRGARLWREGERVFVEPDDALTPELLEMLRRFKKIIGDRLRLRDLLDVLVRAYRTMGVEVKPLAYFDERFSDLEEGFLCAWFWYASPYLPDAPFDLPGEGRISDPLRLYRRLAETLREADRGLILNEAFRRLRRLYEAHGESTLRAIERHVHELEKRHA